MKNKTLGSWYTRRLIILSCAFCLILLAPILTYYFRINFIQGWYQSISIGNFWFVSPLEGLESILTSRHIYLPLLIGMAFPVLLALFLGRIFCAWICPISFFSEIIEWIIRLFRKKRHRKDIIKLPRPTFWFSMLGELSLAMIIGAPIFVFLSPPGLVGREIMMAVFFHTLALEGLVVVIVLLLHLLTRRFFCRYLCPLGALLGFLGTKRRLLVLHDSTKCNNCNRCRQVCPLGLDPAKGDNLSGYCWNCGECIDVCRTEALSFTWKEIRPSATGTDSIRLQKPERANNQDNGLVTKDLFQ